MSPLKMGSRQVKALTAEELAAKAQSLEAALDAGGDELDRRQTMAGAEIVAKVRRRTALRGGHTVVALAGATGSGKSSLFNTIVGAEVSTVGAQRPTTSKPTAAVWGTESATELLDWLTVGRRHRVEPGSSETPATSREASRVSCCSTCPTSTPASWSTAARRT